MKKINFNEKGLIPVLCILLAGFLSTSCEESKEIFAPVVELSTDQLTFRAEGETKTVKLNSNRTFTVNSSETWCKPELLEGVFDNLKITVSATAIVGKPRTAEITVSSPDAPEKKMTVTQTGIEAILSLSESSLSLANSDTEFSLEIVTNLPAIVFELPAWIHKKSETPQTAGKAVYIFALDPLQSGETRKGTLTVKAADPEISKWVSIPVEFGSAGVNKRNPFIVEAGTNLEGHVAKQEAYWAESGTMFGSNYFIDLPAGGEATYLVDVLDNGNYNFTFGVASWGSAKPLELYIDGVFCGSVSVPASDGTNISQVTIAGVALPTTGTHRVKVKFQGNFGKFEIAWHSALVESITVLGGENLNGIPLSYQEGWCQSGDVFGCSQFLDGVGNRTVDFNVNIATGGFYSLTASTVAWHNGGVVEALVDGVSYGSSPIPSITVALDITVGNIPISAGTHKVSVKFAIPGVACCLEKFRLDYVRAGN